MEISEVGHTKVWNMVHVRHVKYVCFSGFGTLSFSVSHTSHLGGVVVSVLASGPKGYGFEPGQGNGFLRVIKIRSTPSFVWEVKPEVPYRKTSWHVKDLLKSHGDRDTKFSFPSPTSHLLQRGLG
jgi:hypothetical protein